MGIDLYIYMCIYREREREKKTASKTAGKPRTALIELFRGVYIYIYTKSADLAHTLALFLRARHLLHWKCGWLESLGHMHWSEDGCRYNTYVYIYVHTLL